MAIVTRRTALAALGVAAASPVFLATGRASAQTPADSRIGYDTYVTRTLQLGKVARQSSELALEKAENREVREFAELEIAEQDAVASVLAASVAADADLPPLAAEQQQQIDRLIETPAGPDFDLAYIETQIEGHQLLLEVQGTASGEREASLETVTARLAEPAIRSHLAMLGYIQQIMGHARIENVEEDAGAGGGEGETAADPAAEPAQ